MVDLETIGKKERQGHKDTLISDHRMRDIDALNSVLKSASLQVRVNPLGEHSREEIDEVIDRGAARIMLPMFSSAEEAEEFLSLVSGRAGTTLLLETPQALVRIRDIASLRGVDEIHIGLNDLHLGMGLDFMLELLVSPVLEVVCKEIRRHHIGLGIGGVARVGAGSVRGELVLDRLQALGATATILSRSFWHPDENASNEKAADSFRREFALIKSCVGTGIAKTDRGPSTVLVEAIRDAARRK